MKVNELFEAAKKEEIAEPSMYDPRDIKSIIEYAKNGDRVVANGKTIWAGLGNRSGLHSYLQTALDEKWKKSGANFEKKLAGLVADSIEIHEFHNSNRDTGRWVKVKTFKPKAKPGEMKFDASNRKDLRKANVFGAVWQPWFQICADAFKCELKDLLINNDWWCTKRDMEGSELDFNDMQDLHRMQDGESGVWVSFWKNKSKNIALFRFSNRHSDEFVLVTMASELDSLFFK